MLKKVLVGLALVFLTIPVCAGVIHDQLVNDFSFLQKEIDKCVKDIEDRESEIIAENKTKNSGRDLIGYAIINTSVRVTAFRLQGVLRLLKASDLSKNELDSVDDLYDQIKTIEDGVGKMDEVLTTIKNAIKKDVSAAKLSVLRQKADKQSQSIADFYKEMDWFKEDAADKAIKKVKFLKKISQSEEIELVNAAIASEITKFNSKIKNKLLQGMQNQDFSHESMEDNFHEFRRLIRWVAIYLSSLPDLYSLTVYSLEGRPLEEQMILKKYKGNKYAEIKSENSPVVIDRYTFYLLAHYIQLAGDAKDIAEEHFKLLEAGVNSELDESAFKTEMVDMISNFIESKIFEKLLKSLNN